ncbi:MAG: hypothetical protein IJ870_00990 [Alphaproteobacteria bacterium]|nr:hypothetical protein [Alphaproteobacteria bacterium]
MKKGGLTFAVVMMLSVVSATKAWADIEALQALITKYGDVVEGHEQQILKAQSFIESTQQLATQAKRFKTDVENVVKEAEKTLSAAQSAVKTATQKAQEIKDKVNNVVNVVNAAKEGDLNGLKTGISSMDFASLNKFFDGTKEDDEMADAVLENMVRKKGDNSIENQKALSNAINKKNGVDMANMYGKSIVTRKVLRGEKDDFKNPQSVDEAIELFQEKQMSVMKRKREIRNMESTIKRFHHTHALQNVEGEYEEKKNE